MLLWARDTRSSVRGREPETTSMASAAHSPLWVVTARLRKRPRLDSVPGGRLSSLQLLMASSSTFSRPWKKNESKVSLRKTIQNLMITIKKLAYIIQTILNKVMVVCVYAHVSSNVYMTIWESS